MQISGLLPLLMLFAVSVGAQTKSVEWKITQPAWTDQHERQFGEFVSRIGEAVEKRQCGTVKSCLTSTANYYAGSDPKSLTYYSDCADLPYYLRTYFAWKNGLPFSIIGEVKANGRTDDIRYTARGNRVASRMDFVAKEKLFRTVYPNAAELLNETVSNVTSSAFMRMMGDQDQELYSDFYPVKLDKKGIRAGTVIYDPNGHVAVVYKVTDDGRVYYIDAHPDSSITMGMFTKKFVRSYPNVGAGFKNWRPLTLVNAKVNSQGHYIGGKVIAARNSQLPSFSLEQFFGNQPDAGGDWGKGKFIFNNQTINYYDYVRMNLMKGEVHIDPLKDMAQLVDDICISLKDRVIAVDLARTEGISSKKHPDRLPYNIYGTDGEWENYATPSRDARLKTSFVDLLESTKANIEAYKKQNPSIKYIGGNLPRDLFDIYAEKAKACQFTYTMTNNQKMTLNLEAARQRLFNMSFDPYHCVESRWGARTEGEFSSCLDNSSKKAWYEKEKWLRYQIERRYDARMDFTLDQLVGPYPGAGVAAPPDVDIVGYLKSLF